jgi:hypothetical protein
VAGHRFVVHMHRIADRWACLSVIRRVKMNKDGKRTAIYLLCYLDVSRFLNRIDACLSKYTDGFIGYDGRPLYFFPPSAFATRHVVRSMFVTSLDDNIAMDDFWHFSRDQRGPLMGAHLPSAIERRFRDAHLEAQWATICGPLSACWSASAVNFDLFMGQPPLDKLV